MKFLVTGGCGFLGSNLSHEVMKRGHRLLVVDNLYRTGSERNLAWLKTIGDFEFRHCDIRNANDVDQVFQNYRPDVVFHCAGQVAMTTSIENPCLDFEVNVGGGFHILEAVRKYVPEAALTFSSTNKVYGDLIDLKLEESTTRYIANDYPKGFAENFPLNFCSPYGCSKGAVDQYMLDYARIFNLNTIVFRHSSIYGGRQYPTFDQGWVGWFTLKAMAQKKGIEKSFTVAGNGKQVRDLLYVDDIIDCYFRAVDSLARVKGQAFNIGGGEQNSLSILELIHWLEQNLSIKLHKQFLETRASDQKVFIADNSKMTEATGWTPKISNQQGLSQMLNWLKSLA